MKGTSGLKGWPVLLFLSLIGLGGCKTLGEMREQEAQEMGRVKRAMKHAETAQADTEIEQEELKLEIARLSQQIEANYQKQEMQNQKFEESIELLRRQSADMTELLSKLQAAPSSPRTEASSPETPTASYALGKKLFDEKNWAQAVEVLKTVAKSQTGADAKKSQFLLAETYYIQQDYAQSIFAFNEFKERFPKDTLVPRATFRQGLCFKSMGKKKEAALFFQEFIDNFPKHALAGKAKLEISKLK